MITQRRPSHVNVCVALTCERMDGRLYFPCNISTVIVEHAIGTAASSQLKQGKLYRPAPIVQSHYLLADRRSSRL